MKKGLFCAVLVVASLASGWCFADLWKYCSSDVSNSCSGTVSGKNNGTGAYVPCTLDGNAVHVCRNASSWAILCYCNMDTVCEGQTASGGIGGCKDVNGVKGCKQAPDSWCDQ